MSTLHVQTLTVHRRRGITDEKLSLMFFLNQESFQLDFMLYPPTQLFTDTHLSTRLFWASFKTTCLYVCKKFGGKTPFKIKKIFFFLLATLKVRTELGSISFTISALSTVFTANRFKTERDGFSLQTDNKGLCGRSIIRSLLSLLS